VTPSPAPGNNHYFHGRVMPSPASGNGRFPGAGDGVTRHLPLEIVVIYREGYVMASPASKNNFQRQVIA